MGDETPLAEPETSEESKVEKWRYDELIKAGYSPTTAKKISRRPDIDLHKAIKLIKIGCPPDVAARILL